MSNFINDHLPYYLFEIFEFTSEGIAILKNNFMKLKTNFLKTSIGQKSLSFISPLQWNQKKSVKIKPIM